MYRGDIRLGATLDFNFTTRRFSSGAPFALAGSPVLAAYVGNSTTQITAGITLTVDFDGVAGLNHVRVVASAGNGYAAQTDVDIVITTGTVDGVSVVGEVVGSFSIENRSALMPATAGRALVVDAAGLADATAVKVGPSGSGTAQTAGDIPGKTNNLPTDPADHSIVIAATDAIIAAVSALNNLSAAQILTQVNAALDTTLSATIPADGTRPTLRQGVYMSTQFLLERTVAGAVVTVKNPDGTTLLILTLGDATTPLSITRTT